MQFTSQHHVSSARDEEEIETNTAVVGIVICVTELSSLKCMVNQTFFSVDHFPH